MLPSRARWPMLLSLALAAGADFSPGSRMPFPRRVRPLIPANGGFGAPRAYGPHLGVDLAVPEGTAVYAVRPGRVALARPFEALRDFGRGYGGLVVVAHRDGSRSLYSHLESVAVRVGQGVGRHTLLGRTGGRDNGESTGPHLHLMIFGRDGKPRDPLAFLPAGIPRARRGPRLLARAH